VSRNQQKALLDARFITLMHRSRRFLSEMSGTTLDTAAQEACDLARAYQGLAEDYQAWLTTAREQPQG
jgi:hypothetical protein